jgi:hypothetical protein
MLYVAEAGRLVAVAGLEDYQDAELADVEEVEQRLGLVARQLRRQHERLQMETPQEKLYSVCLDYVISVYDSFSIKYPEFNECE